VIFRNEQTVTGKQRAVIEEGQRYIILKHYRSVPFTLNDFAEETTHLDLQATVHECFFAIYQDFTPGWRLLKSR
jgi:RecB family endonuclease NucS